MSDDLLTLPPRRDLPPGEFERRKQHLMMEARALVPTVSTPRRGKGRRTGRRRIAQVMVAVVVVFAVVLAVTALGVVPHIKSWLAGAKDPDIPVPVSAEVVLASGVAGMPWKIIATPTDQGLCLFLVLGADEKTGSGGCGPSDVRGDPSAVGPTHWMGAFSFDGGSSAGLDGTFLFGPVADGVASVDFILVDGSTVHAHIVAHPEGLDFPLGFYWVALPCDFIPPNCLLESGSEVRIGIALDSLGRILERRVPIWNGNPTGNPNGSPPPSPLNERTP